MKRIIAGFFLAFLLCGCSTTKQNVVPKPTTIPQKHREIHQKLLREQRKLIMHRQNGAPEERTESMLPT